MTFSTFGNVQDEINIHRHCLRHKLDFVSNLCNIFGGTGAQPQLLARVRVRSKLTKRVNDNVGQLRSYSSILFHLLF